MTWPLQFSWSYEDRFLTFEMVWRQRRGVVFTVAWL